MRYLAEFYLPSHGVSLDELAARAREAAERLSGAGLEVAFVRAIYVARDESCFAIYRAASPEAVTAAGQAAGIVFDRVVEATESP